jgi:Ca2+-binding RTX toxin-like protein
MVLINCSECEREVSDKAAALLVEGNELDNDLAGDTGNDTLLGNGGDDTLQGFAGVDELDGTRYLLEQANGSTVHIKTTVKRT